MNEKERGEVLSPETQYSKWEKYGIKRRRPKNLTDINRVISLPGDNIYYEFQTRRSRIL